MLKIKKINIFIIFLAFIFGISVTHACSFRSTDKIIIINKKNNLKSINNGSIKYSKCSNKIKKELSILIRKSRGSLTQRSINEYFKNNSLTPPNMTLKKIHIEHIDDLIKREYNIPKDLFFFDFKSVSKNSIVTLLPNEEAKLQCENCDRVGEKSIHLIISNSEARTKRRFLLSAKLKQKILAIFPRTRLYPSQSKLSEGHFIRKNHYSLHPEEILSLKNNLKFYKTNKPLSSHLPLKRYDLSPVNIVKLGQMVKVVLKSGSIKLQTTAKAMNSGTFDQSIKLKLNNKFIYGKAVDYNKVEIAP